MGLSLILYFATGTRENNESQRNSGSEDDTVSNFFCKTIKQNRYEKDAEEHQAG